MTEALAELRPTRNTSSDLSREERREVLFWASARMTAAEIGNRIRRSADEVRAYAESVRLNIE